MANRLPAETIDALCGGEHPAPFDVLGPHFEHGDAWIYAFLPNALRVTIVWAAGSHPPVEMACVDERGLFVGSIPAEIVAAAYQLDVIWPKGEQGLDDPYRFPPLLNEDDAQLFVVGQHRQLWRVLGAHLRVVDGVQGVAFAVWAPNAKRVSVIGAFNAWDARQNPMRHHPRCGIWEIFIPGIGEGEPYQLDVLDQHGRATQKADPFAFAAALRPARASVVSSLPAPRIRERARTDVNHPISIYEVHLGAWRRRADGSWLSYRELADQLIPYVCDLGFTHLELMPITEHPLDASWGYQPVGVYAPTSRYGTPDDFRYFIDLAHRAGLSVFMDWVPGHFPDDAYGLARFDGTCLYEYADPREGRHREWQTLVYDFSKPQVVNYLVANALFWLTEYGLDGLRVDAVTAMLYRDYGRTDGEWLPNCHGGRENLEAMAFLRQLNQWAKHVTPHAVIIAEEATDFPGITRSIAAGGLGFDYTWRMGWTHGMLRYMRGNAQSRCEHYGEICRSLSRVCTERYTLALSHDDVAPGRGSLWTQMPGDDWQRFANVRAYLALMWTSPGKKLLFMGCEFAQMRDWSVDASLDWSLLDEVQHRGVQVLVRDLNRLYRDTPALHETGDDPAALVCLQTEDSDNAVASFARVARAGDMVLVVVNFLAQVRYGYRIGVPSAGLWREVLNTDSTFYGGCNVGNGDAASEDKPWAGSAHSIVLTIAPLAVQVFVLDAAGIEARNAAA